ncbi:MAG TPA: glycosyltransferase family 39 protein, partial [Bryobacteraceae bacterium]|nr:glycosyltransferase family 39 protein [Bryobacteraceae bacterium]
FYHDDSIYWVSARSLATGDGYRIQSLPGEPFQTKYPPLYPALLAAIWKLNPQFPANLPLATLFAWLAFPLFLVALWVFLRDCELSWRERVILVLMAALSPVTVVFSFSLMPELLFTALLLASLILAERATDANQSKWLALAAGVLAALAYLTKSIALPLLVTVPLCFLLRKQFAKAGMFFASMLPAVAGWQWWASRHVAPGGDLATLYYTNYTAYQFFNVPLRDLPLVIWYNLDGFLQGVGKLLIFDLPYGSKHLERVIAIAAIAGAVRLTLRRRRLQYPLAALGMTAILLVWHFPPDQRFVFPLYPLLLVGLATEVRNLCAALATAWKKQALGDRIAVGGFATLVGAVAMFAVFCTAYGLGRMIPDLFATYRADFDAREQAYQWISRNVPQGANVYAYEDPMLFLYTGHKSSRLPIPPKYLYHGDDQSIEKLMGGMAGFAREHRLDYLLLTPDDYHRDLNAKGTEGLARAMGSADFDRLYSADRVAIYKLSGVTVAAR